MKLSKHPLTTDALLGNTIVRHREIAKTEAYLERVNVQPALKLQNFTGIDQCCGNEEHKTTNHEERIHKGGITMTLPTHLQKAITLLDEVLEELGPEGLQTELILRGLTFGHQFVEPCPIEQALNEFLDSLAGPVSTRKTYESEIRQFKNYLREIDLLDGDVDDVLTPRILGDFFKRFSDKAASTINKKRNVISSLYKMAMDYHWIDARKPEILKTETTYRPLRKTIPVESLGELLNLAQQTKYGFRFGHLVIFLLGTGCRLGEALALQIKDIHWGDETATVRGKRHPDGREVYLADLEEVLHDFLVTQYGDRMKEPRYANYFVFSASGGIRPLNLDSASKTFKRCIRKMTTLTDREKLNITTHSTRHTYATQGMLSGVDIFTLRELLGHKHVTTTQIYTNPDKDHLTAAVLKLQGDLER